MSRLSLKAGIPKVLRKEKPLAVPDPWNLASQSRWAVLTCRQCWGRWQAYLCAGVRHGWHGKGFVWEQASFRPHPSLHSTLPRLQVLLGTSPKAPAGLSQRIFISKFVNSNSDFWVSVSLQELKGISDDCTSCQAYKFCCKGMGYWALLLSALHTAGAW